MSKARMSGTEAQVKAEIAYKNAIASGADERAASALNAATLANENQRAAEAAWNMNKATAGAADAMREYTSHAGLANVYIKSIVELVERRMRGMDIQYGDEQFEFSYDPLGLQRRAQGYKDAGTPTKKVTHGIPGTLGAFEYEAPD